jgi:uncharacterized protein YxjI
MYVPQVGRGNEAIMGVLMARYTMRQRLVSIGEDFDIADEHGNPAYRVERFSIDVASGPDMVAQGDILHHEYDIRRGGEAIARISKQRFALSDTYGIEIAPGEDEGLVLAVAVAIDEMAHDSDGGDH